MNHLRAILCTFIFASVCAAGPSETIEVKLRTRTGGAITGLVVDHNDHGVVIVHENTPYVFAWQSLDPGSAYVARRDLLVMKRGGKEKLLAQDRFDLGLFALNGGRNDLAAIEFREARKLEPSLESKIKQAFDAFRAWTKRAAERERLFPTTKSPEDDQDRLSLGKPGDEKPSAESGIIPHVNASLGGNTEEQFAKVLDVYARFNEEVRRVVGKNMSTHESRHFLITTDFPKQEIPQLIEWCDDMYAALARAFDRAADERVFLAKCPVYCFRSRVRFRKFARHFDGYDARGSIGYTRSIEASGHTHVVLLREGNDEADDDRFACTLVHEGTHAFLHRLHSNRLIPHWVNEGFADLMADRVLGDRCGKQKDAALLASSFVRHDWSIKDMLESAGPIGVEQYPLAHSVVRYLYDDNAGAFTEFVKRLKQGDALPAALSSTYESLTLDELDTNWRQWVRHIGESTQSKRRQ